jgi:hypothetical protein
MPKYFDTIQGCGQTDLFRNCSQKTTAFNKSRPKKYYECANRESELLARCIRAGM